MEDGPDGLPNTAAKVARDERPMRIDQPDQPQFRPGVSRIKLG